jgi:hypothetical protein
MIRVANVHAVDDQAALDALTGMDEGDVAVLATGGTYLYDGTGWIPMTLPGESATDAEIATAVSAEATLRAASDAALDGRLDTLEAVDYATQAELDAVETALEATDTNLQASIATEHSHHVADRAAVESALAAETTARTNADTTESAARIAADDTLTTRIATEETNRASAVTTEANARIAADNTLTTNLNSEITNRTNADTTLTNNLATEVTNRSAAITAEANARIAEDALKVNKAGDTMTGHLAMTTVSKGGTLAEKSFYTTFAGGSLANQKRDLYFTTPVGTPLNGFLDVFVIGGGVEAGVVQKRFALGLVNTTINYNFARYAETLGPAVANFAISDLTRDVTNNRWKIQIAHRVPKAGTTDFSVLCQVYSGDSTVDVKNILPTFGIGSEYTTDTTVLPEAVVWFERLFIVQGQTSNFSVPPASSYTVTANDSIILAASGATVTLPRAQDAGVGRAYIVKNVGTSGVTVQVASGGGTIDAGTTMAIGNRAYATFMSDGSNWWRVS